MKLFLCFILAFLLPTLLLAQKKKMTVKDWHTIALKKIEAENWKGSISDLNKGIQVDSTYPPFYSLRALCKKSLGDTLGTLSDLTFAIQYARDKTDSAIYHFNRGYFKHGVKDYAGAIQDYQNVVKITPDYWSGYSLLTFELLYAKRYAEAEKEARATLLMPDVDASSQFYLQKSLAYAHLFQNRYDQASEIFRKILVSPPESVNVIETLQEDKKEFTLAGLQHPDLLKLLTIAKKK